MKILSVSQYKGSTFRVESEGEDDFYINEETVRKYNLKAGLDIPAAAVEEIKGDDLLRKARERALYLLSVRDHCFVELYRKLEKNYPHEICLEICRKMAELGLVNDGAYAEKLAKELFTVKHFGEYRARQEMKRRGLTEGAIDEAITPYLEEESIQDRLSELILRKYGKYLSDEKGKKKVISALSRLGYSYDDIKKALKDAEFSE